MNVILLVDFSDGKKSVGKNNGNWENCKGEDKPYYFLVKIRRK